MTETAFPPPPAAAIERLRAIPTYCDPDFQTVIDRLASGEIGQEETVYQLQQVALRKAEAQLAEQAAREQAEAAVEQTHEQRDNQDERMAANRTKKAPTIRQSAEPGEAPVARVLSSGGAANVYNSAETEPVERIAGLGGASGNWGPPSPAQPAATATSDEDETKPAGSGASGTSGEELTPPVAKPLFGFVQVDDASGYGDNQGYESDPHPGIEYD